MSLNQKIMEKSVFVRNLVIHTIYIRILKPIFFYYDPEDVHDWMIIFGKNLGKFWFTRFTTKLFFGYKNIKLSQKVLGLDFMNPVGLAAGFDKNAELPNILPSVGLGFFEVGSITGYFCNGNPKPRLWRLPKSKGLVINYGLKNKGSEEISNRLRDKHFSIPIGTNIAMTNSSLNLNINVAIKDYAKSFELFSDIGDYFTINISCPNTLGGQPFMNPSELDLLFERLDVIETKKPIFVKLSPDISFVEVDIILEVIKKHKVHGIICTNLTKNKDNPNLLDKNIPSIGGISGKPLQNLSDDLLSYIYKKEGSRFVMIGCGGVFNAEDAYKKIRSGATLIQMITGMIFEGPQVISSINHGLVYLLKRDGFSSISEAIGVDNK